MYAIVRLDDVLLSQIELVNMTIHWFFMMPIKLNHSSLTLSSYIFSDYYKFSHVIKLLT